MSHFYLLANKEILVFVFLHLSKEKKIIKFELLKYDYTIGLSTQKNGFKNLFPLAQSLLCIKHV